MFSLIASVFSALVTVWNPLSICSSIALSPEGAGINWTSDGQMAVWSLAVFREPNRDRLNRSSWKIFYWLSGSCGKCRTGWSSMACNPLLLDGCATSKLKPPYSPAELESQTEPLCCFGSMPCNFSFSLSLPPSPSSLCV
jgi:hypothetical protein